MANHVYANGREISCKAASSKSVAAFPDVCFTPPQTPATPLGVPIPYPNTGFSSDTSDGSTSVLIGGKEVMLKDQSAFKKSTGDEAGSAPKKGLINGKITGKVYFRSWSMGVLIEGQNVVRHLDLTTHNHASELGNEGSPWPQVERVASPPADTPVKPCKSECQRGVSKEERDKLRRTPEYDTAKTRVNARPKPISCPACKSRVNYVSPDHIVPVNVVHLMPGFACLSKDDQSKVVNHPDNFVGLCPSCNSSKSDTLWFRWAEHKKKGIEFDKVDPALRPAAQKLSGNLIYNLKTMVRSLPCEV